MAITAQLILDENGWTTDNISLVNMEYLIDNAINYINLEAGLSLSNLSGVAESKTVTLTAQQETIVKMLAGLLGRAYTDKGPNVSLSGLSISQIIVDPHYSVFMQLITNGINRLRSYSFQRT